MILAWRGSLTVVESKPVSPVRPDLEDLPLIPLLDSNLQLSLSEPDESPDKSLDSVDSQLLRYDLFASCTPLQDPELPAESRQELCDRVLRGSDPSLHESCSDLTVSQLSPQPLLPGCEDQAFGTGGKSSSSARNSNFIPQVRNFYFPLLPDPFTNLELSALLDTEV